MTFPTSRTLLVLSLLGACAGAAHAAEPYVATGFPYLLVGVAQPVTDIFTVRADWGTVGHHSYSGSTRDNDYTGSLKYDRFGLFGDLFVTGQFRVTGGVTVNHGSTQLFATSHGSQIVIGGTTYSYTGDVTSTVTLPQTTPYLGIGWGHAASAAPGFSVNADLGVSFGKPKATPLKAEGQVAQYVSAADLAEENRRFQDGVGQVKGLPQLTIGATYRF
jgi:hypothetical protein